MLVIGRRRNLVQRPRAVLGVVPNADAQHVVHRQLRATRGAARRVRAHGKAERVVMVLGLAIKALVANLRKQNKRPHVARVGGNAQLACVGRGIACFDEVLAKGHLHFGHTRLDRSLRVQHQALALAVIRHCGAIEAVALGILPRSQHQRVSKRGVRLEGQTDHSTSHGRMYT